MSVSNYDLFKIAWRTSFVRLLYNYKCLFGQGICYCIKPALLKTNKPADKACETELISRHSTFFNCNEYLAGFAAGIILKQEEEDPGRTAKVKQAITSPLGAIGDRLFYQLIIPCVMLITVNLLFLFKFKAEAPLFISIFSIVLAFNLLILFLRIFGVFAGYRLGTASLKLFKHPLYLKFDKSLTYLLVFLQGATAANLIIWIFNLLELNKI